MSAAPAESAPARTRRFAKLPLDLMSRNDVSAHVQVAVALIGYLCWEAETGAIEISDEELGALLGIKGRQVRYLLTDAEAAGLLLASRCRGGLRRLAPIAWNTPPDASEHGKRQDEIRQSVARRSAIRCRKTGNPLPIPRPHYLEQTPGQTPVKEQAGSTPTVDMSASSVDGSTSAPASAYSHSEERICSNPSAPAGDTAPPSPPPAAPRASPRRATAVIERLRQFGMNKTQAWMVADRYDLSWVEGWPAIWRVRKQQGFRGNLAVFIWAMYKHGADPKDAWGVSPPAREERHERRPVTRMAAQPEPAVPKSQEDAARIYREQAAAMADGPMKVGLLQRAAQLDARREQGAPVGGRAPR